MIWNMAWYVTHLDCNYIQFCYSFPFGNVTSHIEENRYGLHHRRPDILSSSLTWYFFTIANLIFLHHRRPDTFSSSWTWYFVIIVNLIFCHHREPDILLLTTAMRRRVWKSRRLAWDVTDDATRHTVISGVGNIPSTEYQVPSTKQQVSSTEYLTLSTK